MKLLITGGLGFVGRHLSEQFLAAGHEVTALGRNPTPRLIPHDGFNYIAADTTREGEWQKFVGEFDAVIKRWRSSVPRPSAIMVTARTIF